MGVPTSEVGYTPAMPRREDHEVHKRICGGIGEKKKTFNKMYILSERKYFLYEGNHLQLSITCGLTVAS